MTFTISSKELNKVINNVVLAIETKNNIAILSNIVFQVKESVLTLTASGTDLSLTARIGVEKAEDGAFCVDAMNITNMLAKMPDTLLTFSTDKMNSLIVDYGTGKFTLPTEGTENYPTMPEIGEEKKYFTISENVLQGGVARSSFAVANEQLRLVMTGICFDMKEKSLNIVASDGHLMVKNTITGFPDSTDGMFILTKKASVILKKILDKNSEEEVTVTFNDSQMCVNNETYSLTSKLIEGRYPNYNAVIPKGEQNVVTIDRKNLLAALNRMTTVLNGEMGNLVKLTVKENQLTLNTTNYDGSKQAEENISCAYNGIEQFISLKGTLTIEVLSNISAEEIDIYLFGEERPALIFPTIQPENQEVMILQMPMFSNN